MGCTEESMKNIRKILSFLVFNKDDYNCQLAYTYRIKNVKLQYIGKSDYKGVYKDFHYSMFKIVNTIAMTDKFIYIYIYSKRVIILWKIMVVVTFILE